MNKIDPIYLFGDFAGTLDRLGCTNLGALKELILRFYFQYSILIFQGSPVTVSSMLSTDLMFSGLHWK